MKVRSVTLSGVATGRRTPICGKCEIIFSYIYTNTTKLVLNVSFLARLDCFSNAFN